MDLVLFAFLVVIAGLVAGHQQPQGVGHVGDRHAQIGGLGAIDHHAVLRLAHHQRRIDVHGAGRLAEVLHHFLRVLVQEFHVGAADHELHVGLRHSAAGEDGRRRDADPQVLLAERRQDLLADVVHHLELVEPPLAQRRHPHVDRARVGDPLVVVGHGSQRVIHAAEIADLAGDAVEDHERGLQRRALRGPDLDLELRLVVVRQEVLADVAHERGHHGQHADDAQDDHPAMPQGQAQQAPCSRPRSRHRRRARRRGGAKDEG